MGDKAKGVSTTVFIAGLVVSILVSSALSALIVPQLAVGLQGPKGDTGATGPPGPTGILNPDYDSGWITIPDTGTDADSLQLEHFLGTQDIFVYMIGKTGYGFIHQIGYGGYYTDRDLGASWETRDVNTITIWRMSSDQFWGWWREVRVLIWKLPQEPA